MTVLESIVLITSHLLQLLLSLQYHRTSIQITTALVSLQYFVQEVGFQVFRADVSKSIPIPWTGTQQNPRVKHWDQTSLYWIGKLNYGKPYLWIGLYRDPKNERRWLWVDGSTAYFTSWDTGQPDNFGSNEDCVEFRMKSEKWNDKECYCSLPYIFEIDCKYNILHEHIYMI